MSTKAGDIVRAGSECNVHLFIKVCLSDLELIVAYCVVSRCGVWSRDHNGE